MNSFSMVTIGKILRARGNKGEVAVKSLTDNSWRFESFPSVFTVVGKDESRRVNLEKGWFHKGIWVLKFENFDDISAAETLRGSLIQIEDDELGELPDGQYYYHDLIGMAIKSGAELFGCVSGVVETGASVVLEIDFSGVEYYIPFVSEYVKQVDKDCCTIVVENISGLIDLNEN